MPKGHWLLFLAFGLLALIIGAGLPVQAQDTGESQRAIKVCRAEAAARGVPVVRTGTPAVRQNHDDLVIGFNIPMVLKLDGRAQTVNCRYQSAGRRATLALPAAPSAQRPPRVPSPDATARSCVGEAERRTYRFVGALYQENLRDRRGRIVGRERQR